MRDSSIDTLKGVMIVLVVVGHFIEPLIYDEQLRMLYGMIYLIHMPVFVYLSGLIFSLSKEKRETGFIVFCIVIGQLIYSAVSAVLYSDPWMNYWILWYLYALLVWRMVTPRIGAAGWMIPVAIAVALGWGLLPHNAVWRFSRIISFYPYFLAGYLQIHRELGFRRWRWLVYGAGAAAAASLLIKATASVQNIGILYNSRSFAVLGQTGPEGLLWKSLFYGVGFAAILLLMHTGFSNTLLTKWGKHSLAIYLVHGAAAKIASTGFQISDPLVLGILAVLTVIVLGNSQITEGLRRSYLHISAFWATSGRET